MKVYCPKCNTAYEIDDEIVTEEGKKLRCSFCGNVFAYNKNDLDEEKAEVVISESVEVSELKSEDPEAVEDDADLIVQEPLAPLEAPADDNSMQAIFSRLSATTESLFQAEKELPFYKKILIRFKKITGFENSTNRYYAFGTFLLFIVLAMYSYRFEVVRFAPFMDGFYQTLHIDAKIAGEGLEFQNITWRDFDDDFVRKLEVKGFVVNTTRKEINLPIIHVEMLDRDAKIVQSTNERSNIKSLKPGSRMAISIIITKPSLVTKYIFLTFVK